jgi:signal transduction histidine kinase
VRREARRSARQRQGAGLDALIEARTLELSALSTHLQELAEKEKSELARNLHDELGGLLTAAKMDVSWLQGRVVADAAVQQRLQQLGNVLDEAMDVKRRVVEELRPSLLDHFGLATALRAYLESVSAKSGLECEATLVQEEEIPKDIAMGLFRVLQEALTNVVRHAAARKVRLELASDEHAYSLTLTDDGKGIDLTSPDFRWSHGLAGMRHRVRALGGRLALRSAPGQGTVLEAQVPRRRSDGERV